VVLYTSIIVYHSGINKPSKHQKPELLTAPGATQ